MAKTRRKTSNRKNLSDAQKKQIITKMLKIGGGLPPGTVISTPVFPYAKNFGSGTKAKKCKDLYDEFHALEFFYGLILAADFILSMIKIDILGKLDSNEVNKDADRVKEILDEWNKLSCQKAYGDINS